ncbi:sensor histidine kinase [Virgisporangium ochraceum]|uniref:histidine kinase n=1 Tax=Virgisporangium ochraceum TaxID=65505 RepID=A0A8J4EC89_9ACTN|nr:HAMP domain-containing sensor histidine kinase [Virgisporangium ochraceum]GIJ66612.1 two-component sensor histidine kinase [Virgisporangium ochraceum]
MTLRTRLTLLYAVPFLASGAVLVAIPLLQTSSTRPVGTGGPPEGTVDGPVLDRMVGAAVIGLAAMVVVSVVAGWLVAGRFLRPLWTITATARDISASNLHRRLGLERAGRRDEFTLLAATLDDLFARLEAAFESQRRFVANAAHELRTPLTAERTLLQVALADPDATVDSLRAACGEVLTLGRAQERLIDALLTLATSERGLEHREPVDLAAIAGEVARSRAATALGPADTTGDPRLVEILVSNLVDNAVRYNVPGGRVDVTTSAADGQALLRVSNTGPVVPPGEVERLFEPFQRLGGERLAGGHGLGLAIVRAVATAHGATVTADPRPDGGLTVEVRFPR